MLSSRETVRRTIRRATALVFALAGTFKLALWLLQVLAPQPNLPNFAQLLQVLGVTFPQFFALFVPLLEVFGAFCLWRNFQTRFVAFLLACDMFVAIWTVGLPAFLGRAPMIHGVAFGTEAWRLPLEIGLLGTCVWLVSASR